MDVTIDGNRAHAATGSREGSADDPVVILIHGAGMDRGPENVGGGHRDDSDPV